MSAYDIQSHSIGLHFARKLKDSPKEGLNHGRDCAAHRFRVGLLVPVVAGEPQVSPTFEVQVLALQIFRQQLGVIAGSAKKEAR